MGFEARMKRLLHLLVGLTAFASASAEAASGNTVVITGNAQARVVQAISIVNTAALNFGSIAQPATVGSVTLSPTGAVSSAGGAAGNEAITQTGLGRTPGVFRVTATTGAAFSLSGPATFNVRRGGGTTMSVTGLTFSVQPLSSTASTTTYQINVGGTLNLAANQRVGSYTGTYAVTAVYQ